MTSGSNSPTPCQSEVDAVADILDKFYLDDREESGAREEQEDVFLYSLYDNRTPKPSFGSPKLRNDQYSIKPIDQAKLTEKLKSYMDSTPCGNNIDSKFNVREEGEGHGASNRTAKAGSDGTWTPRAGVSVGYPCSKN